VRRPPVYCTLQNFDSTSQNFGHFYKLLLSLSLSLPLPLSLLLSLYFTLLYNTLLYLLTYLLTVIEFSLGGSSSYTSTDKTNKHKRNNTETQHKQYRTQ